jgi:uncharacterized membrane protein
VSRSSRYLAFFAYLLSLPGALFVLFARRDDPFAVYHARQSLAITIAAIVVPLAWAVIAWACAWIPTVGVLVGLSLFALVIAAYLGLLVSWIAGMIFALRGQARPVPLVGARATRRVNAITVSELDAGSEAAAELMERTSPSDA